MISSPANKSLAIRTWTENVPGGICCEIQFQLPLNNCHRRRVEVHEAWDGSSLRMVHKSRAAHGELKAWPVDGLSGWQDTDAEGA